MVNVTVQWILMDGKMAEASKNAMLWYHGDDIIDI